MSFLSIEFYIFFAGMFLLYLWAHHRIQNTILLIASYVFYAWWDWRFCGLLFLSSLIDYVCGQGIEDTAEIKKKKRFLYLSIMTNLTILGIFKYCNFFVAQAQSICAAYNVEWFASSLHIVLPLGISFYTFQSMGYTIDVYRGQCKATRNTIDYFLYVSFFPQLIAGPIERAAHLLPQIATKRTISKEKVGLGIHLIFWGLFKKVYIADNCFIIGRQILEQYTDASGGALLVALYAFTIRMYCDISGYTDIARGLAKCLGFDLMRNFNLPYFASNISEFWRRWHMSVTYWFRDYVFFPVLVQVKGKAYIASFVTLLCIALWHSLSWNSIVRGLYFGCIVVGYQMCKRHCFDRYAMPFFVKKLLSAGGILLTFHSVCLGWLLFQDIRLDAIGVILMRILCVFHWSTFLQVGGVVCRYVGVLLVVQLLQHWKKDENVLLRVHPIIRAVFYWLIFWYAFGSGGGLETPFYYFGV